MPGALPRRSSRLLLATLATALAEAASPPTSGDADGLEEAARLATLAGEPALAAAALRRLVQSAGVGEPALVAKVAAFWVGWMPGIEL